METDVTIPKRSVSLGSYSTEEINKIIIHTKKHTELMMFYIDIIRNYREFTEEMLENIKIFDDNSKMILIYEYNKIIKSLYGLL